MQQRLRQRAVLWLRALIGARAGVGTGGEVAAANCRTGWRGASSMRGSVGGWGPAGAGRAEGQKFETSHKLADLI